MWNFRRMYNQSSLNWLSPERHSSVEMLHVLVALDCGCCSFRWAVSTVMTRQNQIPSTDSGEVDTALIPLWDMCNHTNGWVGNVNLDISTVLLIGFWSLRIKSCIGSLGMYTVCINNKRHRKAHYPSFQWQSWECLPLPASVGSNWTI